MIDDFEFNDFDDKPIYIRTDVHSCSDFNAIDISRTNSFLQKELHKFASRNNLVNGNEIKVDNK